MAFPSVDITEAQLFSNNPVLITESLSGFEQRSVVATQKFELLARFSNISDAERRALQSFIQEQQGALTTFEIPLPGDIGNSSAGFTGTITTSASGSVGDTSISVSAGVLSTTIVKKGDLIRFAGENKLYTVSADATTNGSGIATINFLPGLISSFNSGITITHRSVSLNCRLKNPQNVFSVGATQFANISLEMIEVF